MSKKVTTKDSKLVVHTVTDMHCYGASDNTFTELLFWARIFPERSGAPSRMHKEDFTYLYLDRIDQQAFSRDTIDFIQAIADSAEYKTADYIHIS